MWFRPIRHFAVVGSSACLALCLASCGSSSPKAASGPGSTTPAAGTSAPAAASGTPVHVVSIIDEEPSIGLAYPTFREGFKVAAAWINHHGGLGGTGHPVDVSFCVTDLNPNGSRSCATQAASSSDVATVGNILNYSNIVNPILQNAGIASIAPQPYSAGDGNSPIAFPINDSYLVTSPAMAAECVQAAHATKLSLLYVNVPAGQGALNATIPIVKQLGAQVVNQVGVSIGTADLSPYVAKLLGNGADGVVLMTDVPTAVKTTQAIRAQGSKVAICGNIDAFPPSTIKGLGQVADGIYVSSMFAPNSVQQPGVQNFVQAMTQYGNTGDSDDFAKQAWASLQLLSDATKGMTTINRQTVLAAMNQMTTWDSQGLLPVIDFTAKGDLLNGTVPKYNNPGMFYSKVDNGQLVATQGDKFFNPLTGQPIGS